MSTYFIHTSSIEVAINVLACRTPSQGVRFGGEEEWEFEWDVETMRKELNMGAEDRATPEIARKYVYSKLPSDHLRLPEIVLKVRQMKADADWLLEKHNKIMNKLMDEKTTKTLTLKKLLKFQREHYPDYDTEGMKKAELVELLRNV